MCQKVGKEKPAKGKKCRRTLYKECLIAHINDREGGAESRSLRNAEESRLYYGIREQCLEHLPGNRKGSAEKYRGKKTRDPDPKDYFQRQGIAF